LIIVKVSDTGTSIPADLLPRIVDLFSSKSVSDPTIQGAGLGLFICKAIVKAHGGTIVAQNNSEGIGATFEVKLPIHSLRKYEPTAEAAVN
jgi:signal transduction histidine kinase